MNHPYQCDYFVHFFNVTSDESSNTTTTTTTQRAHDNGGTIHPQDVYLLKEAVEQYKDKGKKKNRKNQTNKNFVGFVSDTNKEFARDRKESIDEIIFGTGGDQAANPYFVQDASFTEQNLWNILKMWHSQDRVWNLMEESHHQKKYKRVAMLRLDVIYTVPIDIYKVPNETVPLDYNDAYLQSLLVRDKKQSPMEHYFYDYDHKGQHCVVPGFHSVPVNERYFAGPYEAVKIWAKDRFSRARNHVQHILPALEKEQRLAANNADSSKARSKFTDFGLHDERFVAHSLLPAIRETTGATIHVDRQLFFVRVKADGSIWLKDKFGQGRVPKKVLEKALGRSCPESPYEVPDPVLQDKNPGRWQLKCPPWINLKIRQQQMRPLWLSARRMQMKVAFQTN